MKLMQDERFLNIIEYLKEHQTATLAELARLNQVSVDTTRRDIEKLDKDRVLKRVRGGAVYHQADITTQKTEVRRISNKGEKIEVAHLLKNYLLDGQAIALNSGTTCISIAEFLVENYYRLTILTNNLEVIKIVSQNEGFTVLVPGGLYDLKEGAIYGEQCEKDILKYNIDKAILGVQAISVEKGITDFRFRQEGIMKAMLKAAKEKIVVADASKFEKTSYVNICRLDEIDCIISGSKLSEEVQEKYRSVGVKLIMP